MIYLCHDHATRLTKIGFTGFTLRREKELRGLYPSSEFILVFNGDRALERRLHVQFMEHRIFGEWFDLPGDAVDAIGREFENDQDYEALR